MSKRKAQELENLTGEEIFAEAQHFVVTHLQAPPARALNKAQKEFQRVIDDLTSSVSRTEQVRVLATHLDVLSGDIYGTHLLLKCRLVPLI